MARILVSLFAVLLLLSPSGTVDAQSFDATFPTTKLTVETGSGPKTFDVEVALTSDQQAQGLMFRRKLASDAGMLFIYSPPEQVSMWMKNTLIPLDMVFVDASGAVVKIAERTVPMSLSIISSEAVVEAVVEFNAGTASRIGLKPGDKITWQPLGN